MNRWMQGLVSLAVLWAGCQSAGPYGYAREYVPLRAEKHYWQKAQTAIYRDVLNAPERFQGTLVSWFGVVANPVPSSPAPQKISLEFRTHQERHLCAEQERNTCRVTVSESSSGPFIAQLELRSEDAVGANRVAPGSLLRVYCHVTGQYEEEGGPILQCPYYRHWPQGQWVHTGMRSSMRR